MLAEQTQYLGGKIGLGGIGVEQKILVDDIGQVFALRQAGPRMAGVGGQNQALFAQQNPTDGRIRNAQTPKADIYAALFEGLNLFGCAHFDELNFELGLLLAKRIHNARQQTIKQRANKTHADGGFD